MAEGGVSRPPSISAQQWNLMKHRMLQREWERSTWDLVNAVEKGDEVMFLDALGRGGDPHAKLPTNRGEVLCLMGVAAGKGHGHLLRRLANEGLSVEGSGSDDCTPLIHAALEGHARTVTELLSLDANPLATTAQGYTALHSAAMWGHLECVKALLDVTPPLCQDEEAVSPVHLAAYSGHVEVLMVLAGAGWPLNTKFRGWTVMHQATLGGHLDVVKFLVERGADPLMQGDDGVTPLENAVIHGRLAVEEHIRKQREAGYMDVAGYRDLLEKRINWNDSRHQYILTWMAKDNAANIVVNIPEHADGHVMDEDGWTPLHRAAQRGLSVKCVKALLGQGVNPHVLTPDGMTPADLARACGHTEIMNAFISHRCNEDNSTFKELYDELLSIISGGDDMQAVSSHLCRGASLDVVGGGSVTPLKLAVITNRSQIVTLLLACGATLPADLLQEAWLSPDVTSGVLAALTTAYCARLRIERSRLRENEKLVNGITLLLGTIRGDSPWTVAWLWSKGTTYTDLTRLMSEAARHNCPLTASFLQRARAWPFYSDGKCVSPLHAALDAHHLSMAVMLVLSLGACPYVTDTAGRLPIHLFPEEMKEKLEQCLSEMEEAQLESLKIREKSESGKEAVRQLIRLQGLLFRQYTKGEEHPPVSSALRRAALLFASRKGFMQLLYMLLYVGNMAVDEVLDDVCGTTALHQAASHGKDICVAMLLNAGADPLRRDRYGHTPRLLAAMFGHKSTFSLLQRYEPRDPPCRAGTNASEVKRNFSRYLKCYDKFGVESQRSMTPFDHHNPEGVAKKLLQALSPRKLQREAEAFVIDFSEGEARKVREVVMKELNALMDRVSSADENYRGELTLVGSAQDESKLFAPDEFDVNLVLSPKGVDVELKKVDTMEMYAQAMQGEMIKVSVKSSDNPLVNNGLTEGLYDTVKSSLVSHLFEDARLSLVPPGLTRTQVGLALALAWQCEASHDKTDRGIENEDFDDEEGNEGVKTSYRRPRKYPLLLIGVDLVPVLKVPWPEEIKKPFLTPPDASHMYLSNTDSGSWRCSFAQIEAFVLKNMGGMEELVSLGRLIQWMGKLLLSFLKAEPWMPKQRKAFCTWFVMRPWSIPLPSGFCLKNALFRWLEEKSRKMNKLSREDGEACIDEEKDSEATKHEEEHDPVKVLLQLFRNMCDVPTDKRGHLKARNTRAYFGGECEGPKQGFGAPIIVQYLEECLEEEERNSKVKVMKT